MIEADTVFMKRALDQARRGAGLVSPNPMVGALLVQGGHVVGEGFHRYDLLKHGETNAIEMAGKQARGATLYCNLEPCCHHGRTPPCTDALIEAGISRAVIAIKDPYSKVNGRGIEQLREAGIEVEVGLLEDRARRLNESYLKFITTGRPFVHGVLEYRGDLDATFAGWEPSTPFLEFASKYDAVMLSKRPELNRIIVDQALSRERHRPLVIASRASEPGLLEALQRPIGEDISVVRFETHSDVGGSGNVVSFEEGTTHDVALSRRKNPLLSTLSRMEVASLLSLPDPFDPGSAAGFDEFDKLTMAVPSSYMQGFTRRWVFGDIEFDLEDVSVEQAGLFTELTGYPSLQEVA
jgi:pyrimidine deaminase RibD-like protein